MTLTLSPRSAAAPKLDPAAIRRIVESAKSKGLISKPALSATTAPEGIPVPTEGKFRSVWMDVTPEVAKRWLEVNFRNRRLDRDTVTAYARDMMNGVWVPTHQGVAFNDRDELIDGQHRLQAIVECGRTVCMMVTFGLPSIIAGKEMTTMDAVDRGRTRTVADQLRIQHGIKDGGVIAQIAATLGSTCCGERTRKLSVQQTLEIYRTFQESIDYVIMQRPEAHGLRSVGVLAGFAFALASEEGFAGGGTPIAAMWARAITGLGLVAGMPITHLRTFLVSEEAVLLFRSTNRACVELVLQAVFLESKGKPIEKLELGTEGAEHFRKLIGERVSRVASLFVVSKFA